MPINVSLVLYNSGVLVPGDCLQGKVIITTSEEKHFENIHVSFIGAASVNFRSGYGKHHHLYSAEENNLLNHSIVLAGGNDVPLKISAGVQPDLDFSFIIPENLPSTISETCYGKLAYFAIARIKIVGESCHSVSLRQPFTVQSVLDLNYLPAAKLPIVKNLTRELYGFTKSSRGILNTTVKLPQSGFALGENIPLSVEIDNQGKKHVDIAVFLQRKICFLGHRRFSLWDTRSLPKELPVQIASVYGPKIESGTKITWNVPNLDVKSLPSSKNSECGIITVQYELKVKIFPKGYEETKIKVPLTIGTIPISSIKRNDEADQGRRHWNTMPQNGITTDNYPSAPFEGYSDLPPPSYEEAIMSH